MDALRLPAGTGIRPGRAAVESERITLPIGDLLAFGVIVAVPFGGHGDRFRAVPFQHQVDAGRFGRPNPPGDVVLVALEGSARSWVRGISVRWHWQLLFRGRSSLPANFLDQNTRKSCKTHKVYLF